MTSGNSDDENEIIFPPQNHAVAFADLVTNVAYDRDIVKFYFARLDPSVNGVGQATTNVVAQVVMPTSRFVGTVDFLTSVVSKMRDENVIQPAASDGGMDDAPDNE